VLLDRRLFATFNGMTDGPRTTSIGLPQGWVLSPLLYILDKRLLCSNLAPGVSGGEYADDIELHTTARTPEAALLQLAPAVRELDARLDADGASLAPAKSSIVIFARRRTPPLLPPVLLRGAAVRVDSSAKYLGVILDSQLRWGPHVAYILNKCTRRLAFLRCMASVSWGAHPTLLLALYRTTIRALLEYGAGIVDPRTKTAWTKIRSVCSQALRASMGAMPSSPLPSLYAEAAEWPIEVRTHLLTDRLLTRWRCRPGHPAFNNLLQLGRHNRLPPRLRTRPPLLLQRFMALPYKGAPQGAAMIWPCYTIPHSAWTAPIATYLFFPPAPVVTTDDSHQGVYEALRRSEWRHFNVLATDGSRLNDPPAVSAAFYDAATFVVGMFKLPLEATVYLAEAYAVLQALLYAQHHRLRAPLILSDSRSTLQALANPSPTAATPQVLADIRRVLMELRVDGVLPVLAWVPAHKNIFPNEAADQAAAMAHQEGVGVALHLPPSVYYHQHRAVHSQTVQADWNTAPIGRHLFGLMPSFPARPWFQKVRAPRRTITSILRLRIGHAATPAHLARCAGTDSPACECGYPIGDATHLLEHCTFVDRVLFHNELDTADLHHDLKECLSSPVEAAPAFTKLLQQNPQLRF
jgi:ribonuclease HI